MPHDPPSQTSADSTKSPVVINGLFNGPIDIRSIGITVLALLALFYTFYLARDLLQPLVLAFLLSFLLRPIVRRLRRLFIPEILGSALTIAILLAGVGYGIYQLSGPAAEWLDEASHRFYEIEFKLKPITESVQEVKKTGKKVEKRISNITKGDETSAGTGEAPPQAVKIQEDSLSDMLFIETQEFLWSAATMVVFLFLLLASGDLLLRKLVKVMPRLEEKKTAVEIMRQIEGDISTYLATITLINIGVGIAIGLGMAFFGLPTPALWGVMAALLNYIPYLGAMIGTAAVAFVALLAFDHVGFVWLPAGFYVCVNILEAYTLTPLILGRRLTLNPIVIFVWFIIWGWMWGVGGALMAIPLLAVVKIVCDRVEPLEPLGELLGNDTRAF